MKWIALSVLLAAFLLTGGGIFIAEKLKLSWNGYHAVLGMIFLLAGLQILYYPVQFFNGPFWIIYAETCIVLLLFLAAAGVKPSASSGSPGRSGCWRQCWLSPSSSISAAWTWNTPTP
jgi:hypothetical protein